MKLFEIVLDQQKEAFLPGDILTGHVLLETEKPLKARNLCVGILGLSKVSWGVQQTT
jgi:hypothetical protein